MDQIVYRQSRSDVFFALSAGFVIGTLFGFALNDSADTRPKPEPSPTVMNVQFDAGFDFGKCEQGQFYDTSTPSRNGRGEKPRLPDPGYTDFRRAEEQRRK